MRHSIIFLLLVLLNATPVLAARQLQTFELQHAEPEQISQVVRQHLSSDSSVNYYQNTLIVNATDVELEKIRSLLRELDAKGQSLWISLRVGKDSYGNNRAAQVNIPPVIIDKKGVHTQTRTQVSVSQRSYAAQSNQHQGVRATEGHAAFIAAGISVPVRQVFSDGRQGVALHEVNSGFYATARVNGSNVTIELNQRDDQYQYQQFQTQHLQSRVSGSLGTWIAVGSVAESQQRSDTEMLARGATTTINTKTIYLKVELDN